MRPPRRWHDQDLQRALDRLEFSLGDAPDRQPRPSGIVLALMALSAIVVIGIVLALVLG